jgi:hypothetical protein
MIDPHDFSRKQMELAAEFALYTVDHPEVDDVLPEESIIYFEVAGEAEFNAHSRRMAELSQREQGLPLVCVRIKGLAPPQGSRLIDPVIEPSPAVA